MKNLLMLIALTIITTSFLSAMEPARPQAWQSPIAKKKAFAQDIFSAILDGDVTSLEHLLSEENRPLWSVLSEATLYGLTPLHTALDQHHVDSNAVKCLLEHGANPNQPLLLHVGGHRKHPINFYPGWTSCHIAVRNKLSHDILRLLKEHEGDFLIEDKEGWSALAVAEYKEFKSTLNFFAEPENKDQFSPPSAADNHVQDEAFEEMIVHPDPSDDEDEARSNAYEIPLASEPQRRLIPYGRILTYAQVIMALYALYFYTAT